MLNLWNRFESYEFGIRLHLLDVISNTKRPRGKKLRKLIESRPVFFSLFTSSSYYANFFLIWLFIFSCISNFSLPPSLMPFRLAMGCGAGLTIVLVFIFHFIALREFFFVILLVAPKSALIYLKFNSFFISTRNFLIINQTTTASEKEEEHAKFRTEGEILSWKLKVINRLEHFQNMYVCLGAPFLLCSRPSQIS